MFRTLAYLSPLIVGFGVPAALALTSGSPPHRRARAAGIVLASVLGLLLVSSFSDSPKSWLPLSLLLVSLGLLTAGVYLLAEAARAPREVSQILSSLVICALMASVFIAGPIIRSAAEEGAADGATYQRITLTMDVNPFFVMGYSIFNVDLLHLPFFYKMGLADFQYGTPSWGPSAAGFAIAGLVLLALSVGLRRLLPR